MRTGSQPAPRLLSGFDSRADAWGSLQAEAAAAGKPLRIHVEHNNPARGLDDRLGFQHVDTNGVYHLMEWSPG